jgi:hypothetical protein
MGNYPYTYLVTAPRFLGYSFNPVSFWYLYDRRKDLKAMILEVNNTFDERRMYFLKSDESDGHKLNGNEVPDRGLPSDLETRNLESAPKEMIPSKFNAIWSKDFHVSPFNSRKGAYSLKAADPFAHHFVASTLNSNGGQVDNTITLSSSKNHPKLVARVFSTSDSIDPCSLTLLQALKFVISWSWAGFVTFPRIVREAGKLFFLRKLHVWYRPEVLKDSIGRNDTDDERYDCFAEPVSFTNANQSHRHDLSRLHQIPSRKFRPQSPRAIRVQHHHDAAIRDFPPPLLQCYSIGRRTFSWLFRLQQANNRYFAIDHQSNNPTLLYPPRSAVQSLRLPRQLSFQLRPQNRHLLHIRPGPPTPPFQDLPGLTASKAVQLTISRALQMEGPTLASQIRSSLPA